LITESIRFWSIEKLTGNKRMRRSYCTDKDEPWGVLLEDLISKKFGQCPKYADIRFLFNVHSSDVG